MNETSANFVFAPPFPTELVRFHMNFGPYPYGCTSSAPLPPRTAGARNTVDARSSGRGQRCGKKRRVLNVALRMWAPQLASAYLSKPRRYGMFGGRSPFSNIGPRLVWYFMFMNGVSMRCP